MIIAYRTETAKVVKAKIADYLKVQCGRGGVTVMTSLEYQTSFLFDRLYPVKNKLHGWVVIIGCQEYHEQHYHRQEIFKEESIVRMIVI